MVSRGLHSDQYWGRGTQKTGSDRVWTPMGGLGGSPGGVPGYLGPLGGSLGRLGGVRGAFVRVAQL